jgi:aarF domain-containing kinase
MGKWMRRFGGLVGVSVPTFFGFDWYNDQVLTRGIVALGTAGRVSMEYKFADPQTLEELSDLHARSADSLVWLLLRNEGLFIKFGQALSSLNHVLPPEYTTRLQVLLDQAPTSPTDQIMRIIAEDLGRPAHDVFIDFDENPVAAASIAQVHKAKIRLADGTQQDVAVKVLKPRIPNQVWWDLTVHDIICYGLEYSFGIKLTWTAKTIRENLYREVDFKVEADYTDLGREVWAGRPDLYIPKLYREYCSERVLVTEWIEATKMLEVDKIKAEFNPKAAMQTLMEAYGEGLFRAGFVHADPHPANVMIRWDPKRPGKQQVILIDFGLCMKTSDEFRRNYARVWRAIFTQNMDELEEVVKSWGIGDAELFASFQLQKPFSRSRPVHSSEITKKDLKKFQNNVKNNINRMLEDDSRIPRELIFVGRGAQMLRSMNKSYGAPVNRANIFASKAVDALGGHKGRWSKEMLRYEATLAFLALAHWWTQAVNGVLAYLFASYRVATLEDVMEEREKSFVMQHSHRMEIGTSD